MQRVTDAELLARAREGDHQAFGELVGRHQQAVLRAALTVLGRVEEAEEVAQEAFVTAHRRLGSLREASSFRTWVARIAWRRALDRRRGFARGLRRLVGLDAAAPVVDRSPSPERALARDEERREVRRLVEGLPRALREVLLLAAWGEHTGEEMARIVGAPVGTIKWRLSEARRLLKERLRARGYGDG